MSRRLMIALPLAFWLCLSAGCASSFARRATEATGVCGDRRAVVGNVSEEGETIGWDAGCDNTIGSYSCFAERFGQERSSGATYNVTCEYEPICSNDQHDETATATVER